MMEHMRFYVNARYALQLLVVEMGLRLYRCQFVN